MLRTVEAAPAAATVIALHPPRSRRPAEAQVVRIAERVAAILFDGPAHGSGRLRLAAQIDGAPLDRPLISTSLALRSGGTRYLLLVGIEPAQLARSRVTIALGAAPAAAIDPDWLQSPLADSAALIDGLADAGRRRLLKLFLTTGSSLFGRDGTSEFGRAAHRLLALLGVAAISPASWCQLGSSGRLLTYRVDAKLDAARIGNLVALSAGRIVRLGGCQLRSESGERGGLLHVLLPSALPEGAALIGLGETPVHLRTPEAASGPRALVPWLARRAAATQGWVQAAVEAASAEDAVAAAQLREICHAESQPRLVARHLTGTPAGVLHALALEDPHGLVRAIRIERDGAALDVPVDAGPPCAGYAALARRSRSDDRYRLRLIYGSGRVQTAEEGRLAAYRGEIPAGLAAREPGSLAAVAEARLALERPARPARCETFGQPPERPLLSVIAAVGDNLDLVRARAAMLFAEPGARDVELLYHVAAGGLAAAAGAAIADAASVYGVPHRLVTLPAEADAADRLLAALAQSCGAGVLLLGADVLPAAGGWLAPWLCRLVSARPVLGGTLLDVGGAVIDAGGEPGEGGRRHAGLPAADLPILPTLATRAVTAECVGLTRAAVELMCATGTRYPNPDVMLAETVARLLAEGKEAATLLRSRFVRYAERSSDGRAERVDAAAVRLVLKRSFSPSGDEGAA